MKFLRKSLVFLSIFSFLFLFPIFIGLGTKETLKKQKSAGLRMTKMDFNDKVNVISVIPSLSRNPTSKVSKRLVF